MEGMEGIGDLYGFPHRHQVKGFVVAAKTP